MAIRGWGDSLVEGLQAADASLESRARRAESGERVKESQQRQTETDGRLKDQSDARLLAGERKNTVQLAGQEEGLKPFEVYGRAAQIRLQAGDLDGYEDFAKKEAATKAQWFSTAFEDAYRTNDIGSGLKLLNSFPDGVQYDVQQAPDGSLVGVGTKDGKEIGRQQFKSADDFWSMVQTRAKPGDIYARLRQQQIDERERLLNESKIRENDASTDTKVQQGQGFRINNDLLARFGPQYEAGKVQLVRAQAGAAGANASESQAGAGLKRAQTESVKNGTGLDGTGPRGMGTNKLTEALVDAYLDPVKRTTLSPQELAMAEQSLRESGRSVMRPSPPGRPAVPGQAQPGVPAAKDYSSLWK